MIAVARPVIEESRALTQSDLVDVIQQTSQDHMMAAPGVVRPDVRVRVPGAVELALEAGGYGFSAGSGVAAARAAWKF